MSLRLAIFIDDFACSSQKAKLGENLQWTTVGEIFAFSSQVIFPGASAPRDPKPKASQDSNVKPEGPLPSIVDRDSSLSKPVPQKVDSFLAVVSPLGQCPVELAASLKRTQKDGSSFKVVGLKEALEAGQELLVPYLASLLHTSIRHLDKDRAVNEILVAIPFFEEKQKVDCNKALSLISELARWECALCLGDAHEVGVRTMVTSPPANAGDGEFSAACVLWREGFTSMFFKGHDCLNKAGYWAALKKPLTERSFATVSTGFEIDRRVHGRPNSALDLVKQNRADESKDPAKNEFRFYPKMSPKAARGFQFKCPQDATLEGQIAAEVTSSLGAPASATGDALLCDKATGTRRATDFFLLIGSLALHQGIRKGILGKESSDPKNPGETLSTGLLQLLQDKRNTAKDREQSCDEYRAVSCVLDSAIKWENTLDAGFENVGRQHRTRLRVSASADASQPKDSAPSTAGESGTMSETEASYQQKGTLRLKQERTFSVATELADSAPAVLNFNVTVAKWQGEPDLTLEYATLEDGSILLSCPSSNGYFPIKCKDGADLPMIRPGVYRSQLNDKFGAGAEFKLRSQLRRLFDGGIWFHSPHSIAHVI